MKERCRKGVPDPLRGHVWPMLVNAHVKRRIQPGLYASLLRQPVPAADPIIETIERDINRTFPLHSMFAETGGIGQTSLFRVLRAYAQYDKKVGLGSGWWWRRLRAAGNVLVCVSRRWGTVRVWGSSRRCS